MPAPELMTMFANQRGRRGRHATRPYLRRDARPGGGELGRMK
jgi:hypothetical protein